MLKNKKNTFVLTLLMLSTLIPTNVCAVGLSSDPSITSGSDNVTKGSASLHGAASIISANERGFEYGMTTSYGNNVIDSSESIYTKRFEFGSIGDVSLGSVFRGPKGVAVDSYGNVFVMDNTAKKIKKFGSDGTFITEWGSEGSLDRQFLAPLGISCDTDNNVYVTDGFNNNVQKFDNVGKFVKKWGTTGSGDGQFNGPGGIHVSKDGYVYVADYRRVQRFDLDGNHPLSWDSYDSLYYIYPGDIATDSKGDVFVTHDNPGGSYKVLKYSKEGRYIGEFFTGTVSGPIYRPSFITIDEQDNVIVADGSYRFVIFDKNGAVLQSVSYRDTDDAFMVEGLEYSSGNGLYVLDAEGVEARDRVINFNQTIDADITGLECNTTYHYRAYAKYGQTVYNGSDMTFTTSDSAECQNDNPNEPPIDVKPPRTGTVIGLVLCASSIAALLVLAAGDYRSQKRRKGSSQK